MPATASAATGPGLPASMQTVWRAAQSRARGYLALIPAPWSSTTPTANGLRLKLPAAAAGVRSKDSEDEPMATDLATHYLDEARRQLRGHKRMGERAMAQLRDDDFFLMLDPESNSVAIL